MNKEKKKTSKFHQSLHMASIEVWAHLGLCQSSSRPSPITPARLLCTAKKRLIEEYQTNRRMKGRWGRSKGDIVCSCGIKTEFAFLVVS